MHNPNRHAWIAAAAVGLIAALGIASYFGGGKRLETLAGPGVASDIAFGNSPKRPRAAVAPIQQARLPLIEPVADLAGKGLGAALALAESDGARARIVRLTPAGPAREEGLPRSLHVSLAHARPLFELAYRLESGLDPGDPAPIDAASWRALWAERANRVPAWLMSMPGLATATRVPVGEVLASLAEIRGRFRSWPQLRARLRASGASGANPGLVRHFGSSLAAVSIGGDGLADALSGTSGPEGERPVDRERLGAFIGWIGADRPAVFSGASGDRDLVRRWARNIEDSASAGGVAPRPLPRVCVEARFAPAGGLNSVRSVKSGQLADEGPLRGYYQARLEGGHAREFLSKGEMEWRTGAGDRGFLRATLTLDEYVARVIDRVGVADDAEAAKAVAIVARAEAMSWPVDGRGCRVSAQTSGAGGAALAFSLSPASLSARKIASWTADLGLTTPTRRPASSMTPPTSSEIMKLAAKGLFFDEILRTLVGAQVTVGRPAPTADVALSASQN